MGLEFDVRYRPSSENVPADVLSRDCLNLVSRPKECKRIVDAHSSLCHPGVERLWQYVKDRKWPVSLEEVRAVVAECQICSKVKPRFCKTDCQTLIKASRPWERIAIDFKGPVPKSKNGNEYLLILVDEYSRFPMAFPCQATSANSVITALTMAFSLFGLPDNVHSDRGSSFVSLAVRNFLKNKGIHVSNGCPYHPGAMANVRDLLVEYGKVWNWLWKTVSIRWKVGKCFCRILYILFGR